MPPYPVLTPLEPTEGVPTAGAFFMALSAGYGTNGRVPQRKKYGNSPTGAANLTDAPPR